MWLTAELAISCNINCIKQQFVGLSTNFLNVTHFPPLWKVIANSFSLRSLQKPRNEILVNCRNYIEMITFRNLGTSCKIH